MCTIKTLQRNVIYDATFQDYYSFMTSQKLMKICPQQKQMQKMLTCLCSNGPHSNLTPKKKKLKIIISFLKSKINLIKMKFEFDPN